MAKVDGLLLYLTLCCLYQFVVYVSANIHPKGGKVNAGQDDGSYKLTILQLVVYTVSMLSAERLVPNFWLVSISLPEEVQISTGNGEKAIISYALLLDTTNN